VEKSHFFQNPCHPEGFPGAGPPPSAPLPASPWRAHSHLGQRKLAGLTGTFVCGGSGGGQAAGTKGEEWRAGGQQLYKGSSVCSSCPRMGINNMYIYLYIYPSGLGRRLGAHTPLRAWHGRFCPCGGQGTQPLTEMDGQRDTYKV
jgi:hypothetical protein